MAAPELKYVGDPARIDRLMEGDELTFHAGPPSTTSPFMSFEWDGNINRLSCDLHTDLAVVYVGVRQGHVVVHRPWYGNASFGANRPAGG